MEETPTEKNDQLSPESIPQLDLEAIMRRIRYAHEQYKKEQPSLHKIDPEEMDFVYRR